MAEPYDEGTVARGVEALDRADAAMKKLEADEDEYTPLEDRIPKIGLRRDVATLADAPSGIVAERSDRIDQLVSALARFQGKIHAVKRNAANPFFKSRYADLAAVMEVARIPLAEEQLALFQSFEHDPARPDWITTVSTLAHGPSGQWITNRIPMRALPKRRKARDGEEGGEEMAAPGGALTAQDIASGAQYGRRYGAMALLMIVAEGEDDDGNRASGRSGQKGSDTAKAEAFLADKPELVAALQVEHATIADIRGKLYRYGSINENQIAAVMKIADYERRQKKESGSAANAPETREPGLPSEREVLQEKIFQGMRRHGFQMLRNTKSGSIRLFLPQVTARALGWETSEADIESLSTERMRVLESRLKDEPVGVVGTASGGNTAGPATSPTSSSSSTRMGAAGQASTGQGAVPAAPPQDDIPF
jgi:hypothetical protein